MALWKSPIYTTASPRCPEHDVGGDVGFFLAANDSSLEEGSRVRDDPLHVPAYDIDGAPGPLPCLRYLRIEKARRVYDDPSCYPEHDVDGAPNSFPRGEGS